MEPAEYSCRVETQVTDRSTREEVDLRSLTIALQGEGIEGNDPCERAGTTGMMVPTG